VVDADQTATAVRTVHGPFNPFPHGHQVLLLARAWSAAPDQTDRPAKQGLDREHDVQFAPRRHRLERAGALRSLGRPRDRRSRCKKSALEEGRPEGRHFPLGQLSRLPNPLLVDCSAAPE